MPDNPVWTTVEGASPINEEPIELVYTRERGWSAIYRASGRLAEIRTEANTKIAAGWSPVRIATKTGGDMHTLTAESSTIDPTTGQPATNPDSLITSVWNILGNELEKDLWEKPVIQTIIESIQTTGGDPIGYHNAIVFRQLVDSYLRGTTTATYKTGTGADATIELTVASIIELVNEWTPASIETQPIRDLLAALSSGVEKFPVSQYVLEHIQTGPATSSLRGVTANTNRVHTRSYMANVQQVPSNKLDEIPDGVYLKKTPTVITEGDKLTVRTQWWWAESWNRFALGEAING